MYRTPASRTSNAARARVAIALRTDARKDTAVRTQSSIHCGHSVKHGKSLPNRHLILRRIVGKQIVVNRQWALLRSNFITVKVVDPHRSHSDHILDRQVSLEAAISEDSRILGDPATRPAEDRGWTFRWELEAVRDVVGVVVDDELDIARIAELRVSVDCAGGGECDYVVAAGVYADEDVAHCS